ncbi:MAG: hypothetical protein HKN49_07730 [Gammaproteobacteria bacterium]|nr:hypothetical protein [Gammaproteobacteria bacterium]
MRILISLAATTLLASPLFAAPMTVSDANSDFTVTYDTNDAGVYGTVFLSNNTIFFLPDAFLAESSNGGVSTLAESITLTLTAVTPGFSFDTFLLNADGDYYVNGPTSSVSADGLMDVSAGAGSFQAGFNFSDNVDGGPTTQQWAESAILDSTSGWGGSDTSVTLILSNTLSAISDQLGDSAFIQKKFEGVSVSVNAVPLPAGVWLLLSALVGVAGLRRR